MRTRGCTVSIASNFVHNEIQHHLLKLDLVAFYSRKFILELRAKLYAVFPQIEVHNRQNRPNGSIDVNKTSVTRVIVEHRTNTGNDLTRTMPGLHNLGQ